MKKIFILIMAAILVISAAVFPAAAEEADAVDQTTSATVQGSRNGKGGRMPGQNNQLPRQPGQNNQLPQQPGQNNQMPRQPGNGSNNTKHGGRRGGMNGRQAGTDRFQQLLDQMLKEGVITQEVYDAILAYIKAQQPQQPADSTAPAEGAEPPAEPDGNPAPAEQQFLKDLLDKGQITQEQYDLILSGLAPAETPAETGSST